MHTPRRQTGAPAGAQPVVYSLKPEVACDPCITVQVRDWMPSAAAYEQDPRAGYTGFSLSEAHGVSEQFSAFAE